MTWMLYRSSKACMSDGGQAEPPITTSPIDETSARLASRWASRSVKMVGTAPANVGRSASIIAAIGAACRNRSVITIEAPTMKLAYGRPQAIAWNIGTIASTREPGPSENVSADSTCRECR